MPSVKRRASKILNEYSAARSELIGKAVALTDGKAGTVENVWLDELHGFGFPSQVMMEDGRSQPSGLWSPRPRSAAVCPDRALLSKQSNQDEKPDLGQESDAHDRDRKEHVARRQGSHDCLAFAKPLAVNHSG
jgi:hypothetical protein